MKTEQLNFRVTEKTKLKLLQQAQYYNKTLSNFVLGVAEKACELDVVQVWINAYIDFVIKRNRADNGCIITHHKENDWEYWNVPPLKNCYESRIEMLDALDDACYNELPKMWEVLDKWDEFIRRLKLLGMYKEDSDE